MKYIALLALPFLWLAPTFAMEQTTQSLQEMNINQEPIPAAQESPDACFEPLEAAKVDNTYIFLAPHMRSLIMSLRGDISPERAAAIRAEIKILTDKDRAILDKLAEDVTEDDSKFEKIRALDAVDQLLSMASNLSEFNTALIHLSRQVNQLGGKLRFTFDLPVIITFTRATRQDNATNDQN